MICSDILGEIIETAVKDPSETVDQVRDSILDMINLDVINLDSPGIYLDPIFRVESPMEVKLEERDELILLDSPTPSPPSAPAPTPANDTVSLHPYGATDIRTMTDEEQAARKQAKQEEEERAARRKAKKALKKKRSKEVKKQQKMLKDSEPQKVSDWVELCDADAEASDPPPSAPSVPSAPPTPAPRSLPLTPTPPPRRTPISAPSTSSLLVSPSVAKKKIQGLMDVVVENPFARRALLGSPPSPSSPSTPSRHSTTRTPPV